MVTEAAHTHPHTDTHKHARDVIHLLLTPTARGHSEIRAVWNGGVVL